MNRERLLRLLADNHRPLKNYLRGIVGEPHNAEELAQETMLRAWCHRDRLEDDEQLARGWLYRVAHNIAIDELRRKRVQTVELTADPPATTDAMERLLNRLDLAAALALLSEEQRSVLIEVFFHGATATEAADTLQIPYGTAKSRLFHGLRRLRTSLAA
jgi:RNA polymerase sigma-70 factor (ECF subfamily)